MIFQVQINQMENQLTTSSESTKFPEDFVLIFRRLLFYKKLTLLPMVGSLKNLDEKMKDQCEITQKLQAWIYQNEDEKLLFDKSKALIIGPWGSGRSLCAFLKAYQLASNGQRVLFIIRKSTSKATLQAIDYRERFKEFPNVLVLEINFDLHADVNEINIKIKDYPNIFFDEISEWILQMHGRKCCHCFILLKGCGIFSA